MIFGPYHLLWAASWVPGRRNKVQGAQANLLSDGQRLHLHHGPIDLIVEAFGSSRDAAYRGAAKRFSVVLEELVSELPALRARGRQDREFVGPVAQRMQSAIAPFCDQFVTPMAAVAGAVADDILQYVADVDGIHKAYVNNGGDIAFHLKPGSSMTVALASAPGGRATLSASDPYRGMATSGWRGRSLSLGIADAVTVVARDAASADVAATLIANAVDLPDCPTITRAPANEIAPDSDLGALLVTTSVGELTERQAEHALQLGRPFAEELLRRQLIGAASIQLCNRIEVVGPLPMDHDRLKQPAVRQKEALADARV